MGLRYATKKKYVWTSSFAYCVGLITTDGCLSSDNRHIDFTTKDLQLAKVYRAIIRPSAKIGTKSDGHGQIAYRVQIGDVALYDLLLSIGLTPRKSKTLGNLNIPSEYYADFLRGCFDGDGSIYGFWDKRWKHSLMYYTVFSSASPVFLYWLRDQNLYYLPTIKGTICGSLSAMRVLNLKYAKNGSKQLYNFMFYSSDLPTLKRKHNRFLELLKQDPYP